MENLIWLAGILTITCLTGSAIEKNHYKNIIQREIALIKKPFICFGAKKWKTTKKIKKVEMVVGEVVLAGDYFKTFTSGLLNLFGGNVRPFESLLDRARREAILRMREKALWSNIIVNTRIETIMINDSAENKNHVTQCAVIAYGTAISYE